MKGINFGLLIGFLIILSVEFFVQSGRTTSLSIAITTDRTQYIWNEIVSLKITNNLDIPIWYIGYPQPDLVFWKIEKYQNNEWKRMNFWLPFQEGDIEICRMTLYEQPIGFITGLKADDSLVYEWNQKICSSKGGFASVPPDSIERGKYRFAFRYSLHTVKTEDVESEPWKRPIELGEAHIVYSNEFVLE
ncbi:MAG: hypothetical protein ACL93V_10405 [Candidatus Electrothrix sp. YB6]